MEFYKKIYYPDKMKNRKKFLRYLKKDKKIKDIYCICTYKNNNFLLDIINVKEIYKEINKDKKYILFGIAYSKQDSIELLPCIIDDLYKEPNKFESIKLLY